MVTAFLAWSLLAFPQGYTEASTRDNAMFQVRWGAEYLLKLFTPAATRGDYTIIYQVGNWSTESQYWGTYEPLTAASMPRPGYNVSSANGKEDHPIVFSMIMDLEHKAVRSGNAASKTMFGNVSSYRHFPARHIFILCPYSLLALACTL